MTYPRERETGEVLGNWGGLWITRRGLGMTGKVLEMTGRGLGMTGEALG